MKPFDLSGKTGLVTGSTGGIGFAIAQAGANLIAHGLSRKERSEQALAELQQHDPRAHLLYCNLSQPDAAERLTEQLTDHSVHPDIIVFNAAVPVRKTFDRIPRKSGFEIIGLEGDQFHISRIKEGLPGRDEDLDRTRETIRNMGKLGIRLLCYNFMTRAGWYRNRLDLPERGRALVSGFSLRWEKTITESAVLSRERILESYRYFLDAVLPVAEESGVTVALHPDDTPRSPLHGVSRIACMLSATFKACCTCFPSLET